MSLHWISIETALNSGRRLVSEVQSLYRSLNPWNKMNYALLKLSFKNVRVWCILGNPSTFTLSLMVQILHTNISKLSCSQREIANEDDAKKWPNNLTVVCQSVIPSGVRLVYMLNAWFWAALSLCTCAFLSTHSAGRT